MEQTKIKHRIMILVGIFCLICLMYVFCLAGIVLTGEKPVIQDHTFTYVTVKAARGQIYDRNGVALVTNKYLHNLVLDDQTLPDNDYERNKALLTLLHTFSNTNEADKRTQDKYPFLGTYPNLTYTPEVYTDTTIRYRLMRRIAANEWEDDVKTHTVSALEEHYVANPDDFPKAETIVGYLMHKYGLDEKTNDQNLYTDAQINSLLRLYYDMECNDFGGLNQYTFATDVSFSLMTKIEEMSIPGIAFSYTIERQYEYPGYASHILGTIGSIYAEDWDYYKELGYNMNDIVGISGCEYAFESYLRGIDGLKVLEFDGQGNLVNEYYEKTPVAGNDVYLTIDIRLQVAAEDGLAQSIEKIRRNNKDCDSGAMVAQNPNTGEILAIASYPTFDLTTYNTNYSDLFADPSMPLYNRALQGLYAPGSTFKMSMVVAGMETGCVDASTRFFCDGAYINDVLNGYHPKCWVHPDRHGYIDAANALSVSCNCYFYELGLRMGIERMNQYCHFFGFGQKTGIELYEETGILAGEAYREQNGLQTWMPGDTVAAAIGQSDNTFTPIQITSYISTLLNGGTRYTSHLLHSVKTHFFDETVVKVEPQIQSELAISQNTMNTVCYGMKLMVQDSASVSNAMRNVPVTVGGKTGTAQRGGKLIDNALFVCAAPYDQPEIVISVVIESGEHGYDCAPGAAKVLEAYYGVGQE